MQTVLASRRALQCWQISSTFKCTRAVRFSYLTARFGGSRTVQAQKTFIEMYKQYRGEYMGSLMTGWLEGMLPLMQNDRMNDVQLGDNVFGEGLNNIVKSNDLSYPPEWRLSRSGRNKP